MKEEDPTRSRGSEITWRRQLSWELRWTAVEMAGVGLGLYVLLRVGQDVAGVFVLCGILVASFLVRSRHYSDPAGHPPK